MSEPESVSDHEQPNSTGSDGFWIVATISAVVSIPFVALNWWQASSAGLISRLVAQAGGEVPAASPVFFNMDRVGLTPVLALVVDLIIFVAALVLARRYWLGLLFVPPLGYLGLSVIYYFVTVVPLLNSITVVK